MAEKQVTPDEMMESLNGFEEIAIAKRFGAEWPDLSEKNPLTLGRALIFIDKMRDGSNENDAYMAAMSMPVGSLEPYFLEDEPVLPGEVPVTEQGKDDSTPVSEPSTSPSGVF